MGLKVLSLFDGMSCGQIALERAGVPYDCYYASEINPDVIAVTQKNYPKTIQIGNVNGVKGVDLPEIDLLMGGSPCQGFSFAGKMLNFDDPRSRLFFEYVRILKECKPTYFLLENVKMKKEHEDVITNELQVQPIEINSNLISAQNRKRLYWTNIPNVTQPQDREITWGDVREVGVNEEKFYYGVRAMQWLGRHSHRKSKIFTVHSDDDKMQMLEEGHKKKYSSQRFFGVADFPSDGPTRLRMRDEYCIVGRVEERKKWLASISPKPYVEFRYDKDNNRLLTILGDNCIPFTLPHTIGELDFLRYITPIECERLQTVPDGYTSGMSDTTRYGMLGDGWTVDVIAHIFRGIECDA